MTDRELLELAAKAAGYRLVWGDRYIVDDDNIGCIDIPYVRSNLQDESNWYWNPIEDDGDALRLAVKLHMFDTGLLGRFLAIRLEEVRLNPVRSDEEIARRAIVRTAAEIGKEMK